MHLRPDNPALAEARFAKYLGQDFPVPQFSSLARTS